MNFIFSSVIEQNKNKNPLSDKVSWKVVGIDGLGANVINDAEVSPIKTWSSLKVTEGLVEKSEDLTLTAIVDDAPTSEQSIDIFDNELTFRGFGYVKEFEIEPQIDDTDTTEKSIVISDVDTGSNTIKKDITFKGFGKIKDVTFDSSLVLNSEITENPLDEPTFTITRNDDLKQGPSFNLELKGLESDVGGPHFITNKDTFLYWIKQANDNPDTDYGELVIVNDIGITVAEIKQAVGKVGIGNKGNISIRGLKGMTLGNATGNADLVNISITGAQNSSSYVQWLFCNIRIENIRIKSYVDWTNAPTSNMYNPIVRQCSCKNVDIHEYGVWKDSRYIVGFSTCTDLFGCRVVIHEGNSTVGGFIGYQECHDVLFCKMICDNCRNSGGTEGFYGLYECNRAFGCEIKLDNCCLKHPRRYAYNACKVLLMCVGGVLATSSYTSTNISFVNCSGTRNCHGVYTSSTGSGFSGCKADIDKTINAGSSYSGGFVYSSNSY